MESLFKKNFTEASRVASLLAQSEEWVKGAEKLGELLLQTIQEGGKLMTCGNGGSHCDALHFAEELTGRYLKDRRPLPALALGEQTHMSCVGNDYGFEFIFSRQVEALGKPSDLLVAISTSGNSKNTIEAVKIARKMGIKTFGLLGYKGGELKGLCDHSLVVPGETTDRIQELHMLVIHSVIEWCERNLFPENYR